MANYEFITTWKLKSPLPPVWATVADFGAWGRWWRGVSAQVLTPADESGLNGVHRFVFRSKLPYALTFDFQTTRVEPMSNIAGKAIGDLHGTAEWTFAEQADLTVVTCDWKVATTEAWMNLVAPVAGPVFRWNHHVIMDWGGHGLAADLKVDLVESSQRNG